MNKVFLSFVKVIFFTIKWEKTLIEIGKFRNSE